VDDPSPPPSPIAAAAGDEVAELVGRCEDFVLRSVGVGLDRTPETLPLLDHYLEIARGGIGDRPEVLELVLRSAGAYFGELVCTTLGGFWRCVGPDIHRWQVCLRHASLAFNPAGVVREVLARGSELLGPDAAIRLDREDEDVIAQRLAALPPVSEEEYYLLATRFEALEITYETLRQKAEQAGIADLMLGPDDYEHLDDD
jgi:hypothetical protein